MEKMHEILIMLSWGRITEMPKHWLLSCHGEPTLITLSWFCVWLEQGSSRDDARRTGGHPPLCKWSEMAVVPLEMGLFPGIMKTSPVLKGISFLGQWTDSANISIQRLCYQSLLLLSLLCLLFCAWCLTRGFARGRCSLNNSWRNKQMTNMYMSTKILKRCEIRISFHSFI